MQQNQPRNQQRDLSRQERLWRRPAVVSRRLPDKTVLLDGITGRCYELNRLGAEVWTLLDGQRTLEEITALLVPLLEVAEPTLVRDIQAFAAELKAAGLADAEP